MIDLEVYRGFDRTIKELEKPFPIINICDVMDWIYFTFSQPLYSMGYDWETEKLKEFCNNFGLYLYEKPREDFFEWEGVEEAEEAGRKGVILSNLS